ncbi:sulfite exporter TauE/SafE family protein [Sulfuritalea sp.]|jgi:uncharacterized membrane protein YfcA|uniref:sulfite exporter TauE/SafE family protein n=1 Tax=Sulfuritalea sp. TaxID=2480090 RepID=UPI001ACDF51F|nr:sulfite exporter TauE/SafE family protein [Sulfuritalea sp.]MBN8473887.1 sulfite exporter TauE/SafE family protein [Sulfuritalea sp.]
MILPSADILVSLALIITIAFAIYGLTGFGAVVAGMPFMVIFIPLQTAVTLMLVFSLFAGSAVGIRQRQAVDFREIWRLLPYLLVGLVLGTSILIQVPEKYLLFLLGMFLLCYSSWSLFFRPVSEPIAVGWAAPLGIGGGFFSALFGTGGPIYTIYLVRRITDKHVLRATTSLMVLISAISRFVLFLMTGFFARDDVLQLALFLLPFVFLGLFVGHYLHRRFPLYRIMQAIWLILMVAGVNVVRQGLAR